MRRNKSAEYATNDPLTWVLRRWNPFRELFPSGEAFNLREDDVMFDALKQYRRVSVS